MNSISHLDDTTVFLKVYSLADRTCRVHKGTGGWRGLAGATARGPSGAHAWRRGKLSQPASLHKMCRMMWLLTVVYRICSNSISQVDEFKAF
jgi:hypothetical protein